MDQIGREGTDMSEGLHRLIHTCPLGLYVKDIDYKWRNKNKEFVFAAGN